MIRNKNDKKKGKSGKDWEVASLLVIHRDKDGNKTERNIVHLHYTQFPDHGVPKSSLIEFAEVMYEYETTQSQLNKSTGPVIVHCTSGAKRSGTFVALALGNKSMNATGGTVNVSGIAGRLRKDRYGVLMSGQHYGFIYLALIDHALQKHFVDKRSFAVKEFLDGMQKRAVTGEADDRSAA